MNRSKIRAVLFDLDGTLLDTDEMIWAGYRYLFAKYRPDYQLQEADLHEVIGPPLKDIFPRYFQQNTEQLVQEYRAFCQQLNDHDYIRPFEGVQTTLQTLHEQGYRLAIVTTKFVQGAKEGLATFGLDHYFDAIIGLDSVVEHKPHPEGVLKALEVLGVSPEEAVFVGDNATDILAGHAANVISIGIGWSRKGTVSIEKANPYTILPKMSTLLEVIKEIDDHGTNKL